VTGPGPSSSLQIVWHPGPRAALRPFLALAEDSTLQLDSYLDAGCVLVAMVDEAIVGHLQLVDGPAPDEIELKNMAVVEGRRGMGIGRALVDRAAAECAGSARSTMLVATATADVGNLRFYQRLGFRMLRIERDAFTPETGYPDDIEVDGIPLRDRVWLSRAL
jgi:GNAT superfamily N-acetyltransferase